MPLRRRTLLTIAATLLIVVLVVSITSRIILLGSYAQLEEQDIRKNLQRAQNALTGELATMLARNQDWAYWDDTYRFVQDRNESYIEANMMDTAFVTNHVNFMAFVNTDGEIVFGKGFDPHEQRAIPVPASLREHLSPACPLLQHVDAAGAIALQGNSGIVMLPEGPVLIVSSPILTSYQEGPVQGSLVWGHYLDSAEVEKLAQSTELSLAIYPFSVTDANTLAGVQTVQAGLLQQSPFAVQPLNEQVIAGYALIRDIYSDPAFILRIEAPRSIYAQGKLSLAYFLIAFLVTGLIVVFAVLLILDRHILSRLARLSATITRIRYSGDLSTPVTVEGNDELSSLAVGMKGMLEALAQSRANLQRAHDELEQRVEERTVALSQANRLLEQEVAERTQAQSQLVAARDQALEALRLKTQILANISHDARTPLNVISLRVEMLKRGRYGPVAEEQIKVLDSILLNTAQLLGFVNNLLSEAQLNGQRARLSIVEFFPDDLIQAVSTAMLPLAERKGLLLTAEIADTIPQTLYGDPERLKQILTNLVDNAIKFTETGKIVIRAYQPDPGHWALQVSDTGSGIPAEAQPHIFKAFWQADGSITRTTNRGVGLGLSIVKQQTTLMGGQVTVQSQEGAGSTFTVILPLERGQEKFADESALSIHH